MTNTGAGASRAGGEAFPDQSTARLRRSRSASRDDELKAAADPEYAAWLRSRSG